MERDRGWGPLVSSSLSLISTNITNPLLITSKLLLFCLLIKLVTKKPFGLNSALLLLSNQCEVIEQGGRVPWPPSKEVYSSGFAINFFYYIGSWNEFRMTVVDFWFDEFLLSLILNPNCEIRNSRFLLCCSGSIFFDKLMVRVPWFMLKLSLVI